DRGDGVAEALVGGVRDRFLEFGGLELVGDEGAGRLAALADRFQRRLVAGGGTEAALEPTPGEPGGVELVADVLARHGDGVAGGAVIPIGLGVAGQREAALAVRRDVIVGTGRGGDRGAVGLVGGVDVAGVAGDEVDRSRRGGAERGPVGVVAHRVVLGVVPKPGDGVAVVVVHHRFFVAGSAERGRAAAGAHALHEAVHQAVVESLLLVAVVVVLVAGELTAGVAGESDGVAVEP